MAEITLYQIDSNVHDEGVNNISTSSEGDSSSLRDNDLWKSKLILIIIVFTGWHVQLN